MKQLIKTGFAALALLLAISCKKENSVNPSPGITSNAAEQNLKENEKEPAGRTVIIGSQVWMAANLDVSRYRNGDKIPQITSKTVWDTLTTGAWCWYGNDSANGAVVGKLYNWYAVNDPRGLAPLGWHVPNDAEWTTLSDYLGGDVVSGGKMKDTGTIHWRYPNTDATNSSGFTAFAGGNRDGNGKFLAIGSYGAWWCTTEYGSQAAFSVFLYYNYGGFSKFASGKRFGSSVRCIKD